ncbi:hypothetical protein ACIQUM_31775 [Amycolatopsis azurea]|uniref:hypothetical protein n=1 Tax=Amycolatopsis azurea TaxID=36819 RepID=UPI003819728B
MLSTDIPEEEKPHIDAIARAVLLGFEHIPLPHMAALFYRRRLDSAIETISICAADEAIAARWNAHEYVRRGDRAADPVWQSQGTVADVIEELLELAPPGTPGAPTLGLRSSSSLVLPGCGL